MEPINFKKNNSYTLTQNEVLTDKTNYMVFEVIKLRELILYETYYDILHPYFREKNI